MFRFGEPGGRIYTSVGAANANLLAYWTTLSGGTWSVQAGGGRHDGGSSLRVAGAGTANYISKTLDAQATWGIAFGFKTSGLVGGAVGIAGFVDSAALQVDLRLNTDGTLSITRNGTVLATSSNSLASNVYYHIELKVTIHPTAGNYELRVNGTSTGWVPAQGGTANTRATANNSANVVFLGKFAASGSTTGLNWDYDDAIVYDAQTTDANGYADINTFIGDCALTWLLPSGAGTTTQFTLTGAASNYAAVNEATPNDDTSYVASSTVSQIDTYALADLPAAVTTVKSVASLHYARKDDVASRGLKAELRAGGGNTAHATEVALSNNYLYYFNTWGQNPNNGAPTAWTVAGVNAVETGHTVSS